MSTSDSNLPLASLTIDDVARRPLPGSTTLINPFFDPQERYLYYLGSPSPTSQMLDLHRLRLSDFVDEIVLNSATSEASYTRAEELRRERLRLTWEGISEVKLLSQGDRDLLLVNSAGRYRLCNAQDGELLLDLSDEKYVSFTICEEGGFLVATDSTHLVRIDLATYQSEALVQTSLPYQSVGVAEYVAQEELERMEGMWVSPLGGYLAYCEVDESDVETYPIVHLSEGTPEIESYRYPTVGHTNAKVTLRVMDLTNTDNSPSIVPIPQEHYLARALWLSESSLFYGLLSRDQRQLSWWHYDLTTKESTTITTESSSTWVNLPVIVTRYSDTQVLLTTEASGYAHLALLSLDGTVQQITNGDFEVTAVNFSSADPSQAWITSTMYSPLSRVVSAVSIPEGHLETVKADPGVHSVLVSPSGRYLLDQHSDLEHSPITTIIDQSEPVRSYMFELGTQSAKDLGLAPPLMVSIQHEDVTLYGALYLPPGEAKELRPAIISVYGGPRAQSVTESWTMTTDLQAQYLAQQGAVVLKLDNRGSYHRGKAFEDAIHLRFGTVELQDQLMGVEYLCEHYGVDRDRIGIYGWSYGGFMTLTALAKAPQVFRVGVAGAPVVDFALYDTAYTERYMGTLASNPNGYAEANLATKMSNITGDLLIIHGLIDENVHFRHSTIALEAAAEASLDVDFMILPKSRHSPRGFLTNREIVRRRSEFLLHALVEQPN